ncbi:OLC1v1004819C1 [Oldenlandia corymbosa var. corymbosa]|uniref:OLC1v1004819C1 n=1 Tax=Oldenlandia corymbosa var. corymbosa TaxID=529605 RepID=A0AAV1DD80_OLDCO|nr:OLC1v1004819C1 [Oldenlandia corymbosa var. corymbosa]
MPDLPSIPASSSMGKQNQEADLINSLRVESIAKGVLSNPNEPILKRFANIVADDASTKMSDIFDVPTVRRINCNEAPQIRKLQQSKFSVLAATDTARPSQEKTDDQQEEQRGLSKEPDPGII